MKWRYLYSAARKFIFTVLVIIFILGQVAIYLLNFNKVVVIGNRIHFMTPEESFTGDIFFSGETYGQVGLVGCNRARGSISRRAHLLTKFNDYLYFDIGHWTSNATINRESLSILIKILDNMKLNLVNLTGEDVGNLWEQFISLRKELMVSANLEVISDQSVQGGIQRYRIFPFKLKKGVQERLISVGVTGICADKGIRKVRGIRLRARDGVTSLHEVMPALDKADIKILLFNDNIFNLKRLLKHEGIRFDLVLAQPTLIALKNRMIYIGDTPVVFSGEWGESVGNIRVYKKGDRFIFENRTFDLWKNLEEDRYISELVKKMEHALYDLRGRQSEN